MESMLERAGDSLEIGIKIKCLSNVAQKEFVGNTNTLLLHSAQDVEAAQLTNNIAQQLAQILIFTTAATLKYNGDVFIAPSPTVIWFLNPMHTISDCQYELKKVNNLMVWKSSSKLIIVLRDASISVEDIFSTFWFLTRSINIIALTQNLEIYSWIPYRESRCNKAINVLKVGYCEGKEGNLTKITHDTFFGNKIFTNLNKCAIYATTSMVYPYVGLNPTTGAVTDGIEVQIVNTFTAKYNATVEYKWLPPEEPFYQYTSTEPYNGAARFLQEYHVDLAFGSMFQSSQHSPYADVLNIPHSNDELAWFIPQPEPTPAINNLYIAFEIQLWLVVLVVLLMVTLTVYVTEKLSKKNVELGLDIIYALSITINYGVPMPKTIILKTFLIFCYIYGLHIVTAYQSSLISFLTKPVMEKPLQTVQEGLDRGLIPYMYEPHRPYIEKEGFPDQKEILKPGRHVFRKEMQFQFMTTFKDKMILGVKSTTLFYLTWLKKVDENKQLLVRTLQPGVLSFHVTILLTRGNPLKPKLDLTVEQLIESGLKEKWMADLVKKNEQLIKRISADGNKPLTVNNLTGAFYIAIFGITLSVATFIFERFVKWTRVRKHLPGKQHYHHTSRSERKVLRHPSQTKS